MHLFPENSKAVNLYKIFTAPGENVIFDTN